MAREAGLFESTNGNVLEAYFLIKKEGGNIPPMWIERSEASRKKIEKDVTRILKKQDLKGLDVLRDWDLKFRKECFYWGLRALLELERNGKTKY